MKTLLNSCMSLAFAGALAVTGANAAQAGSFDDLIQVEVLDGGPTKDGAYHAALRLTLKDGWKTYWRAPGDAGIPPSFSWRGSRNLGDVDITWPTPQVFLTSGLRTIGYLDQLVLPIEITPEQQGKPIRLKGKMELGVCKEVCVPADLKFSHDLDMEAERHPVIAAAFASRPYSAKEAGVRAATCRLTPTASGMQVEARITAPALGSEEMVVLEPGRPDVWASEAKSTRQGDTLIARSEMLHVSGETYALDRSQIRITVLAGGQAIDIQGCSAG